MCAFGVGAVAVDLCIAHEHVLARDADVVKDSVAHVRAVETHLETYVTGFDPRQGFPGVRTAERHHEGVDAVILVVGED